MALFSGLPGWASTRKVKPIWILLKQETVSGSGISWATWKSASRSRQITMPVPHHSKVFLQAGCPSCRPTNSIKALKANIQTITDVIVKTLAFLALNLQPSLTNLQQHIIYHTHIITSSDLKDLMRCLKHTKFAINISVLTTIETMKSMCWVIH